MVDEAALFRRDAFVFAKRAHWVICSGVRSCVKIASANFRKGLSRSTCSVATLLAPMLHVAPISGCILVLGSDGFIKRPKIVPNN